MQSGHLQLANHPAHYAPQRQAYLGYNFLFHPLAGRCDAETRTIIGGFRFVGPDGGTETFTLVPPDSEPPLLAEYEAAYGEAKAAADAAGTLITQTDIIHPSQLRGPHPHVFQVCRRTPILPAVPDRHTSLDQAERGSTETRPSSSRQSPLRLWKVSQPASSLSVYGLKNC